MKEERGALWALPDVMIASLLGLHARLAGDIVEVDSHTWAIHGFIPVDGEVIIAEFDQPEQARAAIVQLVAAEDATAAAALSASVSSAEAGRGGQGGAALECREP